MSDHDHLDPLPEPTPWNLIRFATRGLYLGAAAVLFDAWITQALLGFELPWVVILLAAMSIFAITGAFRDNSLPMIMTFLTGLLIGVLGVNQLRVSHLNQPSVLAGIGL